MAKVKEQYNIIVKNEDVIKILFYCDDEEGYGVDIIGSECGIGDFSFGDDMEFAYRFYQAIISLFEKDDVLAVERLGTFSCTYPSDLSGMDEAKRLVEEWISKEELSHKAI